MAETVELTVVDAAGKNVGTKSVSAAFSVDNAPASLFHQVVRWQRAAKRAGTHATKTRSDVAGGGAKPWRQKGTGRARAGSNSSPIWVGGGTAHGPHPRKYDFRLNRKERRLALSGAISRRREEGKLIVVDSFNFNEIKAKKAREALNALGISEGVTALVVIAESNEIIEKSMRNLAGIKVIRTDGLNLYDILNHKNLILVGEAVEKVDQRLAK
jgi:large subunit ribosomal protein L4